MRKKRNLLGGNVYTPTRRRPLNRKTGQPPNPPTPPNPPVPPTPPTPQQDLTNRAGLDKAYANNDDISLIKQTLYVSCTKLHRMSYIYDDVTKVRTLFEMLYQQCICINHSWSV